MRNTLRPGLDAYYYSFYETGDPKIDAILEAVAFAGKCFHHTDQWNDELDSAFLPEGIPEGTTCEDLIQMAADLAAKK